MLPLKRRSGFSLVDLIVVFAFIGILIALFLPATRSFPLLSSPESES